MVGRPDDIRGQTIVAFVTLRGGHAETENSGHFEEHVVHEIGAIAGLRDSLHRRATEDAIGGRSCDGFLREIATRTRDG